VRCHKHFLVIEGITWLARNPMPSRKLLRRRQGVIGTVVHRSCNAGQERAPGRGWNSHGVALTPWVSYLCRNSGLQCVAKSTKVFYSRNMKIDRFRRFTIVFSHILTGQQKKSYVSQLRWYLALSSMTTGLGILPKF
jgi:hypothetical protein